MWAAGTWEGMGSGTGETIYAPWMYSHTTTEENVVIVEEHKDFVFPAQPVEYLHSEEFAVSIFAETPQDTTLSDEGGSFVVMDNQTLSIVEN